MQEESKQNIQQQFDSSTTTPSKLAVNNNQQNSANILPVHIDSENDEVDADETDGGLVAGVALTCRRESNMIKLNNPYDELTIVRQQQ